MLLVFFVHYATLVSPWMAPGGASSVLVEPAHGIGRAGAGESQGLAATLTMRAPYRWSAKSPDTVESADLAPVAETRHGD